MKIGEALKAERKNLGLTQAEMSKDIVSKSHYSRVENDEQKISSDSLVKILILHHIDINEFWNNIRPSYAEDVDKNSNEVAALSRKIMQAFYNHDIEAAKVYRDQILKLKNVNVLRFRAIVAAAVLENNLDAIDQDTKAEIIHEFNKNENWTQSRDSIRLFANTMPIFSSEQLNYFVGALLNKYQKTRNMSDIAQERIAISCINYLHICCTKNLKNKNISQSLMLLRELPQLPHMLMYKVIGRYYQAIFSHHLDKASEIKEDLKSSGYSDFTKNLPF
ncbi:helix-turn-helix domain-containing protein [Oenococcus sp. UCMA 17063]|nr:helix-turn-helix domain-containing protein [Oenococcus sp. UCMA 17063]